MRIRLFATDVDGVLTDGGMYYSENGEYLKKFNTRDGKGIELLRKASIKTALITSENSAIAKKRAEKLLFDHIYIGIDQKLPVLKQLCDTFGIDLSEVAYIGDDINDLEVLQEVGFSACPADAMLANKDIADYVCSLKGGEGCVREFVERILFLPA